MHYRRLTADEKVQAALLSGPKRIFALFNESVSLEQIRNSPLDIVGAVDDHERLRFYYWIYRNKAGQRAIAFGVVGQLTSKLLIAMMDALDFLLQDGDLIAEIEPDNQISLRIAEWMGGELIAKTPKFILIFKGK